MTRPLDPESLQLLLTACDGGLEVRIESPLAAPSGRQYAFYLQHDGRRIATRGYAADESARFAAPLSPGRYAVKAFVRDVGAQPQRLYSPTLEVGQRTEGPIVSLAGAAPAILHIGLPKTGTTYLQRSFHKALGGSAELPIEYPEAGFYNHQIALYEPLGAHLPWKPPAGSPSLWRRLRERLHRPGERRMLISAEALAGLDAAGIAAFRALLGDRPIERIVITARPLASLLPSHWQQNMKQGGRGTLDDYADRIFGAIAAERSPSQMFCVAHTARLWRAAFADAPISVLVMDGGQTQNLLAFADVCGLGAQHDRRLLDSVPTASEQNLSFSVDECRQLIEINEAIAAGRLEAGARKRAIDGFFQARESGARYDKPTLDAARTDAARAIDHRSRETIAALPGCEWVHGRERRQADAPA